MIDQVMENTLTMVADVALVDCENAAAIKLSK
jgi:hypothetical protein